MRIALSRLTRILSLLLAISLAVGSSWPQETQTAPAAGPPQAAPPPPAPSQAEPAQPAPEPPPEGVAPDVQAKKGATLEGRVLGSDRTTPVQEAVVHAMGADGKVVSSAPTGAKGKYVLSGLEPGTYVLAVSVGGGVFELESPVGVTSARTFTVDLATVPAEAATGVPGIEGTPRGFCFIVQGKKLPGATSFWRSKKGIVVLAVTAGAIIGILAESGGSQDEKPVSPSAP